MKGGGGRELVSLLILSSQGCNLGQLKYKIENMMGLFLARSYHGFGEGVHFSLYSVQDCSKIHAR